MSHQPLDIADMHWLMDMLQTIDVGLVVLDRGCRVQVWNSFMENHSGYKPDQVQGKPLYELFPELEETWLKQKIEPIFQLKSRAFTTWEQRPYVFQFPNYRPITGTAEWMYQNLTMIPLESTTGEVNHVGMILYDVTDIAVNKLALKETNDRLRQLSRTDALTGLYNRGFWEDCLRLEFKRFLRTGQPVTLVMFDIDHFKHVNDTYGHQVGDDVIRNVSTSLLENMRETDIGGRYGGEEFGAILTGTTGEQSRVFAERLRRRVEQDTVHHLGETVRFTISLGIAEAHTGMLSYLEWLEHADQALYKAKRAGRNQAIVYDGLSDAAGVAQS